MKKVKKAREFYLLIDRRDPEFNLIFRSFRKAKTCKQFRDILDNANEIIKVREVLSKKKDSNG